MSPRRRVYHRRVNSRTRLKDKEGRYQPTPLTRSHPVRYFRPQVGFGHRYRQRSSKQQFHSVLRRDIGIFEALGITNVEERIRTGTALFRRELCLYDFIHLCLEGLVTEDPFLWRFLMEAQIAAYLSSGSRVRRRLRNLIKQHDLMNHCLLPGYLTKDELTQMYDVVWENLELADRTTT